MRIGASLEGSSYHLLDTPVSESLFKIAHYQSRPLLNSNYDL